MISSGIRLVTFDATNTLLKFRLSPWVYYARLAKHYGHSVREEDIELSFMSSYKLLSKEHPNFGRDSISWKSWWQNLVYNTFKDKIRDSRIIESIADNLIDDYRSSKCWCPADGAVDILDYLKNKGIVLGVVSNFDPRLHEILHNMNLSSYFKFVLTSYEVGYSKPDKTIFEIALEHSHLCITSRQCLHIGDDLEKDYMGAKNADWQAFLVTRRKHTSDDLNIKECFSSLCELKTHLESNLYFK